MRRVHIEDKGLLKKSLSLFLFLLIQLIQPNPKAFLEVHFLPFLLGETPLYWIYLL